MPVRRTRRRMGGSLSGFWNKTKDFLKKTKLLSTVGRAIAPALGSFSPMAGRVADFASSQGYGRRRIRRRIGGSCGGGSLRPVGARRMGGMISPVGGMRAVHQSGRMSSRVMRHAMPPRMAMKF